MTSFVPDYVAPYQQYVYAYPHKTAYRALAPRPSLADLWADEPQDSLSLYVHVPFCEVRCGFCNLFTQVGASPDLTSRYLDALKRQAEAVSDALSESARTATAAFGGGTPTFLTPDELSTVFDIAESITGSDLRTVPLSVEASPSTATPDRLSVLADRGTTRLSLGVQSFDPSEAKAAVRPQRRVDVDTALQAVRDAAIPALNIDLIYGIDGQSSHSFVASIDAALEWRPEELYLYPLYVRPLTGLARRAPLVDREWDARRLELYRVGRDHLLENGYTQESMRMFRRVDAPDLGPDDYACQSDGMVGLGCGARSYTRDVHYSFDYAVDARQVRGIIDDFVGRTTDDFRYAECGITMTDDERRRRHLLQSVLQAQGMSVDDYRQRFQADPDRHFGVVLDRWRHRGWLVDDNDVLRLTSEGLAYSDSLGPELFSPVVTAAMAAYERR
ncbi:oxygen-independent coproporphyrinogen-3 oxidase [Gordonia malaquae]|uniref:Heme chaperone HemW n=1 Tax=Gordonia malaquae NBRC 108250 TaxID=1223542 RepID=M3UN79_GORML|nr:STM4012 family radical SAM protein [Gordonia malaquae]GAC81520.1 oxygen-independent coproporphyrinogen III oxidase [Gordonia malaquae NBRC 108250]SEB48372.1 oxygen-independent coproporphyrinogen-3 oxidase [Gordonia malaquae]